MIRYVRVQLNPTGFTYDIYSGTSITGITDLVCDDVTNFCDFPISNTITDTDIYLKLVSKDCVDQIIQVYIGPPDCSFEVSIQQVVVNVWVPELRCERESIFGIRKTITGISSPMAVSYDAQTRRVYVADSDDFIRGNIYWFDPVTATSVNHMVYYSGNSLTGEGRLRYNGLNNAFIDLVNRRILMVGTDVTGRDGNNSSGRVNGLISYDINNNNHRFILDYGSDAKFERALLYVTDQHIYLNDGRTSFIRLNRNDFSGRIDIPINNGNIQRTRFLEQTPHITRIGNFLWLVSTGSGTGSIPTTSSIGIFDNSFNLITTITLPGVALVNTQWNNCCFYRQNLFYDQTSNRVLVNDHGSSQRFIIEPNSTFSNGTILTRESLSGYSENRNYVGTSWSVDPFNNNLYESFVLYNCENSTRAGCVPNYKYKTYLVDRTNFRYTRLLNDTAISNLSFVNDGLTNSVMGFSRGSEFLSGDAFPNWNTDGTITIYNNTIQGENTGNVIVNQLLEYNSNTNLPTGNVKPNDPADPDYVTSPYFDIDPISGCPITYTLNCPVVLSGIKNNRLSYELGLTTSTRLNPVISGISVTYIYDLTNVTGGTAYHYAPYTSNYINGEFASVPDNSVIEIRVRFISSGGTILNTCNY